MLTRPLIVALLWTASVSLTPAVVSSGLPTPAERAIEGVTAAELRQHVEQLASDAFAGRGLGQEGNLIAERYIAGALSRMRVPPAGAEYAQPIGIYRPSLGRGSTLTITQPDGTALVDLMDGADFFPLPASVDREVAGRVVFAGHGLSGPGRNDDYENLDVRGAIVLVLEGSPGWIQQSLAFTSSQKAELATVERKIADARAHGAAGLLVIREYTSPSGDWPGHQPIYRLSGDLRRAPLGVASLSARVAGPVRTALEKKTLLEARLKPAITLEPLAANNILAMIEGRDPAAGMVVVGAHLDHDGVDASGQIYNGADDNASGTAAVLAMAAAFARAAEGGHRPARAVVFAFWNGEEQGSLGAEQFVAEPVPARRIVASINLDMVGRAEDVAPGDPRLHAFARTTAARSANVVHLLGYSYTPDLARIVNRANGSVRLKIRQDYDRGAQNLLQRSDHWPFLKRGVPAVFLTTGLHPDYHTPADDTERIDFQKLERITELAGRVAWLAADGEATRFRGR